MSDTTNLKQSADTIRTVLADYRDTLDLKTQQMLINAAETLEQDEPKMLVLESILGTEVEQREAQYYWSYRLNRDYENLIPEETSVVFDKHPFNSDHACTLSRVSVYGKHGLNTFDLSESELDQLCCLWLKWNIARQKEAMAQEKANAARGVSSDDLGDLEEHPF